MRQRQPTADAEHGLPDAPTVAARVHLLRASAFGAVGSGIGVFGHAWAGQHGPALGVLLASFLLLTAYALLAGRRRVRGPAILAAVAISQAAVHATAVALAGGDPHAHHAAREGRGAAAALLGGSSDVSLWTMLAVHAVAVVAGALLLLRLEARAWRTLSTATRTLGRRVAALVGALRVRRPRRLALTCACRPPRAAARARRCATCRWLVVASGRRGPPLVRIA